MGVRLTKGRSVQVDILFSGRSVRVKMFGGRSIGGHSIGGRPPLLASQLTESAAGRGALSRACNLTSFSPCLTGPEDYPLASRHKGPGFKSRRGYLCETGILLIVLSRYKLKY
jgi:hypothetical protein